MATKQILSQIKRLRKERGLSQVEMASSLHVALKTYQNIESGHTRIDIDRLEQIAGVLDTDFSSLIGLEGGEQQAATKYNRQEELFRKIIQEKEAYISQLEESVRFYREILRERVTCPQGYIPILPRLTLTPARYATALMQIFLTFRPR